MVSRFNPMPLMRRHPILSATALVIAAVLALLVSARLWISTDGGRDFVVSQLDGRDVAGYGKLSIRKLEGDPLSDFSVGEVEIRDATGVWFSAEDARVSWSPFALLSRTVDLEDVAVKQVTVSRRPQRTPRPERDGGSWAVRLGSATIDRLVLAEGVAGPKSASSISARFLNARDGAVDARLQITPLDGAGDRIEATIIRDPASGFDLKVDGYAPAGGVFAHLLQLEEGASALVSATAAGNLDDGRGEARLTVDGSDKVLFSGKIEDGVVDASIRLDAGALPIPEKLADFLGPSVQADLSATFTRSVATFSVIGRVTAGTISLSGKSRTDRFELTEPARLQARLATLSPYWDAPRAVALDGTIERRPVGYQFTGDASIEVRPEAGLPFTSVAGPVTASLEDGRIPFTGNVTVRDLAANNATAAGILGPEMIVSGSGNYEIASRRLVIDAAELTHKSGTAQILGEADFRENQLNVSGKVTQAISALPGGFRGSASGFVQAKGALRDFELGLNLNLADVASSVSDLNALVAGRGSLRGMLQIKPDAGSIDRLEVKLSGLEGQVRGPIYGPGSPDLDMNLQQLATVSISGNDIDLNRITANLRRASRGYLLTASSEDGSATVSGRSVDNLAATTELLIEDGDLSGPVGLTGRSGGQASAVSFRLDRSRKMTRFQDIEGRLGSIDFAGFATLHDNGLLEAEIDADAKSFSIAGITFGTISLRGTGGRPSGAPFELGGEFEARDVDISSQLKLDAVTGTITTTEDGYRFDGRLVDKQPGANSDLGFSGLVSVAAGAPSGDLTLSGQLLGEQVSTRKPVRWKLGDAPTLEADIALLGGSVQATLRPGTDTSSSSIVVNRLAIAPALAALGYPPIDAIVSGRANGRLYGSNPEGEISLKATSAVTGVDTAINLNLDGRLDQRALTLTAQSSYGPDLKANAAGRLPVRTSPTSLVSFDRKRPLEALLDVNGDLAALRLVALAYGHDIEGALTSRTELSGTLEDIAVKSQADISNGLYEYGATGLSLKDLEVSATLADRVVSLTGSGKGTQGGGITLDGRLAEAESGVTVKLTRLLVYDRLGDQARLSGDAKLTEGAEDRVLSGALRIDDSRFNIDNFANDSIRTLNVRWTTDDPDAARKTVLQKPVRLDLTVTSQRGLHVTGRGLDSDWGVNLGVTGRPDNVLLNGNATLVRGSLELAQRPFEFESGRITFDGPLDTARMAISATREVDGFSVRADVTGAPADPSIELSSTPSLPQDEILSRMLFGRSSVDLSALEAAELARSIARLAGQDTGIDPVGVIQSSLGVDRLRLGVDNSGNAELGVGQYLAPDVYLEVTTKGAAGNTVEVEWQPRPQVSVASETSSTGDSRVSVRWKKDY